MVEFFDANYSYLNLDRYIEQTNFYFEGCANNGNIENFRVNFLKIDYFLAFMKLQI